MAAQWGRLMQTTPTLLRMPDQVPALTRDNVRDEAFEILSAIDASRPQQGAFEAHWRRLWQLVREARAAYLPWWRSSAGPWHISHDPDPRPQGTSANLIAGNFVVSIWPPDQAGLGTDLPGLLNWAGVPEPHAR
jgi:hypothetical protein